MIFFFFSRIRAPFSFTCFGGINFMVFGAFSSRFRQLAHCYTVRGLTMALNQGSNCVRAFFVWDRCTAMNTNYSQITGKNVALLWSVWRRCLSIYCVERKICTYGFNQFGRNILDSETRGHRKALGHGTWGHGKLLVLEISETTAKGNKKTFWTLKYVTPNWRHWMMSDKGIGRHWKKLN